MRLKEGDPVKLFDGMSGEWLGIARAVRKRDLVLDVTEKLREREAMRSEEHTSALQSLMRISYAVFCLKKKKEPHIFQTLFNIHTHTLNTNKRIKKTT